MPSATRAAIERAPILQVLARASYQGWLVAEAEQDPDKASSLEDASISRRNPREVARLQGRRKTAATSTMYRIHAEPR